MLNQLPKRSLYEGGISKATCELGFDSFVFEISILLFSSSKSEVQRFASVGILTELWWCENDDGVVVNIFTDNFLTSPRCGLTSRTLCETRWLLSTTRLDEQNILLGHHFNHHNDPIMISLQQDSGFSRVLIFTVLGVGHFNRYYIIIIHHWIVMKIHSSTINF